MVEAEPNLTAQLETAEDNDVQVDFSKNKKKKKKKVKKDGDASGTKKASAAVQEQEGFNWNIEGHKDYEYTELLDRIETIMNEKNA